MDMREYRRQYRLNHPEKFKKYKVTYYQKHKEECIAYTKAWIEKNRERHNARCLNYYYRHREERLAYGKKKQERTRQNTIHYGQRGRPDILNVTKDLYPEDNRCSYCGRTIHYSLRWHHWDDSNPGDGVWLCQKCHAIADALLRRSIKKGIPIAEAKIQISNQLTIPSDKN